MRAVVQRVSQAHVSVGEEIVGKIGPGLLVLLGVAKTDTETDADYLTAKITGLRVFEDENGKMNLSLADMRRRDSRRFAIHVAWRRTQRQAAVIRRRGPPDWRTNSTVFHGEDSRRWHSMRDRSFSGNDES